MKQLLFAILILVSSQTFAQVDTTQLPITVKLKVKHVGYMAANLSGSNSLKDRNLRDSLVKYLGSGNVPDSIVNVKLKSGYLLNFIEYLFTQPAKNTYNIIYELGNGGSGNYPSIISQLFIKGNTQSDNENGVARWLFTGIYSSLNNGSAIMDNNFINGKTWLKTPIIQN